MPSFLLLVLLTTLGAADSAQAQQPLVKAELAFEDLEFEQAARHFEEALAQPGSREERLRAYRGLGMCRAFLGDPTGAQAAFETLLLMDPQAKVNVGLGPKVAKPFAAARRAVKGKRPEVRIERDAETGNLSAELAFSMDAANQVVLHVRSVDGPPMKAQAAAPGPASLEVAPWREVTAWAVVEDAGGGALFIAGTREAPLRFVATARPPPVTTPAIAAAVESAREERPPPGTERSRGAAWSADDDQATRPVRWPLWVGGAVVLVGGGVAAAYALRPGEPLQLPPAGRTGRLP